MVKPRATASGVPTICSRITATSAPKSHPNIGTRENSSRILLVNPLSAADNSLLVASISIPFLFYITGAFTKTPFIPCLMPVATIAI